MRSVVSNRYDKRQRNGRRRSFDGGTGDGWQMSNSNAWRHGTNLDDDARNVPSWITWRWTDPRGELKVDVFFHSTTGITSATEFKDSQKLVVDFTTLQYKVYRHLVHTVRSSRYWVLQPSVLPRRELTNDSSTDGLQPVRSNLAVISSQSDTVNQ